MSTAPHQATHDWGNMMCETLQCTWVSSDDSLLQLINTFRLIPERYHVDMPSSILLPHAWAEASGLVSDISRLGHLWSWLYTCALVGIEFVRFQLLVRVLCSTCASPLLVRCVCQIGHGSSW